MCGRYTIIATAREIERRFNVEVPDKYTPRYNAAPTQMLPIITNENPKALSFARWGLLPTWALGKSVQPLINSRIETIIEKPSFNQALTKRRCLIPADGYYEWKRLSSKSKIPYRICTMTKELFCFAGIWELFKGQDQQQYISFSIITTSATEELEPIHNRMPLILDKSAEMPWLENQSGARDFTDFLSKHLVGTFTFHPVSSLVNSVMNESPALIEQTPATDQYGNMSLF